MFETHPERVQQAKPTIPEDLSHPFRVHLACETNSRGALLRSAPGLWSIGPSGRAGNFRPRRGHRSAATGETRGGSEGADVCTIERPSAPSGQRISCVRFPRVPLHPLRGFRFTRGYLPAPLRGQLGQAQWSRNDLTFAHLVVYNCMDAPSVQTAREALDAARFEESADGR